MPSTIDTFYRAKSALEGFFNSFLALQTESWIVMPLFTMVQSIWSVTMLARWAKVMGPGRSRPSNAPADILAPQKVIWDPSSQSHSTRTMFGTGMAPVPSFEESTEASRLHEDLAPANNNLSALPPAPRASNSTGLPAAPRLAHIPPAITDPAQISATHLREAADPDIPRVVAALKAKLHAQPGLNLDIVGVLSTLARRCEQAHERLLLADPGADGAWQNDLWYMCGKKVLIARAKLEKWAEIIAAGGVAAEAGQRPAPVLALAVGGAAQQERDHDVAMGNTPGVVEADEATAVETTASAAPAPPAHPYQYSEEETMAAFQREIKTAAQGILPPEGIYNADMYGGVWTDSMFDPLDPSQWFNDGGDWSMALLGANQDMPTGF